jgi:hypothetical protein
MSKKKKRKGQCVYCGRLGPTTDDHIPSEALFAKDDRRNLIKVPSCIRCNNKAAKEDEYFKLVLTLNGEVFDHPDVQKVLPSVLRSLHNPHNRDIKIELLKTLRRTNPRTPGGLLLPAKPMFVARADRVERVIERVTKGLFFHEKGYRLPDDHMAIGFSPTRFIDADKDFSEHLRKSLIEPVSTQKPKTIGNDVFSYKFLWDGTDPNSSAWLFLFYKRVPFIGGTFPIVTDS